MRENLEPALIVSATRTNLYFRDKVNMAAGQRASALFFERHLDNFIKPWQILLIYRDFAIKIIWLSINEKSRKQETTFYSSMLFEAFFFEWEKFIRIW